MSLQETTKLAYRRISTDPWYSDASAYFTVMGVDSLLVWAVEKSSECGGRPCSRSASSLKLCEPCWDVFAPGLIIADKTIQWPYSCAMSRMVRISSRVRPGMRTSFSCMNPQTPQPEIAPGGGIDDAGAAVGAGAGAGKGAAAGQVHEQVQVVVREQSQAGK